MLIWRFLEKRRSRFLFLLSAMTIIFVMTLFCRKESLFCLRTTFQQWKISRQTKCRSRHRQVRFCDLISTMIWIFQLRNRVFRCSTCCNWKRNWSTWSTKRKSWKHDCRREWRFWNARSKSRKMSMIFWMIKSMKLKLVSTCRKSVARAQRFFFSRSYRRLFLSAIKTFTRFSRVVKTCFRSLITDVKKCFDFCLFFLSCVKNRSNSSSKNRLWFSFSIRSRRRRSQSQIRWRRRSFFFSSWRRDSRREQVLWQ